MNNWLNFLNNYDYSSSLSGDAVWTLDAAVDYLSAYKANKRTWASRDDAFRGFLNIRAQIVSAVQQGISSGHLFINEAFKASSNVKAGADQAETDFRKSTVVPLVFIDWAIMSNMEVPKQFKQYADRSKANKAAYYENLGIKKICIHHERSRAVAELLWKYQPDMPIAVMACRSEIVEIGCGGHKYDARTIMRWLAPLKSDGKAGRPRKRGVSPKNSCAD